MIKQSIALIIFELFCLYRGSLAVGGADYSGDIDEAQVSSINCGTDGQGIMFVINIPDGAEWTDSDKPAWALTTSNCQPTSINSGVVTYGPFNGDTCKTTVTETATHLVFTFVVDVQPTGSLTFAYDHHYQVTCQYNKVEQGIQASFLPLHSVANTDSDSSGVLTLHFTLYFGDNDAEISPATTIDLKTAVYGRLTVEGEGFPALDVHYASVKATTSQGDDVTLITDGCSVNDAVDDPTCDTAPTDDFSLAMGAFRFSNQPDGALVTFEVTAVVCLNDGLVSQCETECGNCGAPFRKRRETVQESLATKYYLKAGPYKFANVEQVQKDSTVDEGDGSAFPTYLVAILAVSGVVVIAIASAAVVIVLRKRRRNATLAESRGTYETGTGAV